MRPFDDAASAVAYIHAAHEAGKKDGLSNTRRLLAGLGNPQDRFAAVHIAGTNGKGSVCSFVHAALRCAGYRVGLYTSPYLQRYNERVRIDGASIPDERLARLMDEIAVQVELLRTEDIWPTEFEIGTVLAFLYFAREAVDIAVVEVGLGGRLDPTNVLVPSVSAIASIGLDHTQILGDTIEKIAYEKACIAKPGVPLVICGQASQPVLDVVRSRCDEVGAPLRIADRPFDGPLGLAGAHQSENAMLAAEILRALRPQGYAVSDDTIAEGLRRARWPGRLEWVQAKPPVLLDGAHNPQGVNALTTYLLPLPCARTVLVFGVMADKDWASMIDRLSCFVDEVVTVAPQNTRALNAETLAEAYARMGVRGQAAPTPDEALHRAVALAGPDGRVIVAGSLYLVGAIRELLLGRDEALQWPE